MRVCVVYSYGIDLSLSEQIRAGLHPKVDWLALPALLGATIVDSGSVKRSTRPYIKGLSRLGRAGGWLALTELAWSQHGDFDVFVFGNENLALLFLARAKLSLTRNKPRVVIINHHLSAPIKASFFRLFGLKHGVDALICLNRFQAEFARRDLALDSRKVVELPFGACVDGSYFAPRPVKPGPHYILAVGREARDYPTLIEALRDLEISAKIVVSGMGPNAQIRVGPAENVRIEVESGKTTAELRELYAGAAFVVVPLHGCDYPAGITSIMEAMAMGKAVIVSRSRGILEFVEDAETGFFVRIGDACDLRSKIIALLRSPELAERMGARARQAVAHRVDIDAYVSIVSSIVSKVGASRS